MRRMRARKKEQDRKEIADMPIGKMSVRGSDLDTFSKNLCL